MGRVNNNPPSEVAFFHGPLATLIEVLQAAHGTISISCKLAEVETRETLLF